MGQVEHLHFNWPFNQFTKNFSARYHSQLFVKPALNLPVTVPAACDALVSNDDERIAVTSDFNSGDYLLVVFLCSVAREYRAVRTVGFRQHQC